MALAEIMQYAFHQDLYSFSLVNLSKITTSQYKGIEIQGMEAH